LVDTDVEFSIFVSLALVKPVLRSMSRYFEAAFHSPIFQERFKATGSGLLHIHLVDLRAAAIPLAPIEEQPAIELRAHQAMSRVARQAGLFADSAARLVELERALSAKAFRGELVPQDPSDEAAAIMLARLRAEPADEAHPRRRARAAE
jgi:type I restriction enzyme S subunit